MVEQEVPYGIVNTTDELGQLVRKHRKQKQLTLARTASLANVSVRFLSEFERGKDTAEIGKVLKALRTLGLELSVVARGTQPKVSAVPNLPVAPHD